MSTSFQSPKSPKRINRYELQKQLGQGSIGEVWKAIDLQTRREVVVKLLHADLQSDPNFMTRFDQVGRAVTSLRHPNIVLTREFGISRPPESSSTTPYIVMDYIEGPSLAEVIRSSHHTGTLLPVSEIVHLFKGLGAAIDFASQNGIFHGDVKPANILLRKNNTWNSEIGEPLLTDFATVRLPGNSRGGSVSFYTSPEQAQGQPADQRSDIYSLGVILYELCTGVAPFRGESSVSIRRQLINPNSMPTPPQLINPNIPPALSEVILRAMAKDPATRFPTASLLATAIAVACSLEPETNMSLVNDTSEAEPARSPTTRPLTILGVSQPLPMLPPVTSPSIKATPNSSGTVPAVASQASLNQSGALPAVSPVTTGALPSTGGLQASAAPPKAPTPANLPPLKRDYGSLHFKNIRIYIVLAVLLLLIILGSALFTVLLPAAKQQQVTSPVNNVVGHGFFQDDALGRNDMLRIELQNIPAPATGKSYYAWLQGTAQNAIPLGPLTVENGSGTLLYPGDGRHTNLLSVAIGFSITLENSGSKPQAPSGHKVYQGIFDPAILPYIKNILYLLPSFPSSLPTKVGIVAGLLETIKSINEKAGSIVDDLQGTHDYALVERQALRIIQLIDGTDYARSSGDMPANAQIVLPKPIPAGLISSPTQPGYIDTLVVQIDKIKQASGNNAELQKHLQNINNAIADLQDWVQKMRTYTVQILKAPRLSDPAVITLALQLKSVAADSYTGHTIPPNEGPLPIAGSAGAQQAYVECQYLATIDVRKV